MSITLNALALPDDLHWTDELSWTPVVQSKDRFENGHLLRRESLLVKGRPITLEGDSESAWCDRALVLSVIATRQTANAAPMNLTIHGQEFSVVWDFEKEFIATPIRGRIANPGASEPYYLKLCFIEV